jgi:hypothetical protein
MMEKDKLTCQIKWSVNPENNTPKADTNPAIGYVRLRAHDSVVAGRTIHFDATEWWPICAIHAKLLKNAGMEGWEFWPIDPGPQIALGSTVRTKTSDCTFLVTRIENGEVYGVAGLRGYGPDSNR